MSSRETPPEEPSGPTPSGRRPGGPGPSARVIRAWALAGIWAVALLVASSFPRDAAPASGWNLDKVLHAAVYAILGLLVARAAFLTGWRHRGLLLGLALAWAVLVGGMDELHQSWIPGRTPDVLDLVADVVGGLLGALVVVIGRRTG